MGARCALSGLLQCHAWTGQSQAAEQSDSQVVHAAGVPLHALLDRGQWLPGGRQRDRSGPYQRGDEGHLWGVGLTAVRPRTAGLRVRLYGNVWRSYVLGVGWVLREREKDWNAVNDHKCHAAMEESHTA